MNNHQHTDRSANLPFWRRKTGVVLLMLIAIGAFYVVREHFNHVYSFLPYLILLICPLMHFFGHGHVHGGHGRHGDQTPINKDEKGK
ncbi:DUF2933 domain-containing protein [Pseudomonas sp. Hz4]